jgi:hypothetical protein
MEKVLLEFLQDWECNMQRTNISMTMKMKMMMMMEKE